MTSPLADALTRGRFLAPRADLLWFLTAVAYFLLVGGGNAGEQLTVLRAINLALGMVLVAGWVRRAREHDGIDRAVVVAVLLYTATGVLSSSLRLSLEPLVHGVAYAALFVYARRLLARADGYAGLVFAFGFLCLGLTAFFVLSWGAVWLEWARLTGFGEIPPLSLPLPTGLYLHRHDITLLIVMLAPALFLPVGPGRLRAVRVAALVAIGAVLFMDGSRTVLAAIAGAGLVVGAVALKRRGRLWSGFRLGQRGRVIAAVAALGVLAVAVVMAEPLMSRLLQFGTLSARGTLWSEALSIWLRDPLSGSGPGTFLFALFEIGHYDTTAYFPRNTDGAPFLLLAETGLLGVAGIVVPLIALLRGPLARARPAPVLLFGPAAFLIAGIGQVPADFAYLVVPPLLWLAAAYPAEPVTAREPEGAPRGTPRLVRLVSMASVAVIVATLAFTVAAGFAYEDARRAVRAGDMETATQRMQVAAGLDPTFALYPRGLGELQLSVGHPGAALVALRAAESAEPRDPTTAWLRALAFLTQEEPTKARESAERALDLQRSEPHHFVVAAIAERASGDEELASRYLDRYLVLMPTILGAQEWPSSLGARRDSLDAGRLLDYWALNAPELAVELEPAILAAMAQSERHRDVLDLVTAPIPRSREAVMALFACDPEGADDLLDQAATSERALPMYWAVRIMVGRVLDRDVSNEVRLGRLTGLNVEAPNATTASGPRHAMWAYRRLALPAVAQPYGLPPMDGAFGEWLADPRAAAAAAGYDVLAACRVGR